MAKEFAKDFYKSKAWKICRSSYIKSVNGVCERCGSVGYIVHHKIHLDEININNPEVSLNWDNLEYLCLECHNQHHKFGRIYKSTIEGLVFDDEGNLIEK